MPTHSKRELTQLLQAWSRGDKDAFDQLYPMVEAELKRRASAYLRKERPGHTLQTMDVINEAYLRLIDITQIQWQDRTQFFAMSARLMRRILVDHFKAKYAQKRGAKYERVPLDDDLVISQEGSPKLIPLDDALTTLANNNPRASQIVELRFFGGLTIEEVAEVLGISIATANQDWQNAKEWLHKELSNR